MEGGTNCSLTKRLLSLVMSAVMIFFLTGVMPEVDVHAETIWDGSADIEWYDSNSRVMHISTAEELAGLAQLVNSGNSMDYKTIILDSDIMLNDISDYSNWWRYADDPENLNLWIPIGNDNSTSFCGTFDGGGHIISGLYCKYRGSSVMYSGLFGVIKCATIKNIVLDEYNYIDIYNTNRSSKAGGICAYNNGGTISGCGNRGRVHATGVVVGDSWAGGICGFAGSQYVSDTYHKEYSIKNCYNQGDILGEVCGGIVGYVPNASTISNNFINVYNTGKIGYNNPAEYHFLGGILGYSARTVYSLSKCYYLSSNTSQGIGNENDPSGVIKTSNSNMKSKIFASSLGSEFIYNENGYPLFAWEQNNIKAKFNKDNITIYDYDKPVNLNSYLTTNYAGVIEWFSDDEDVATVKDGVVNAVSNGTTTIFAICGDVAATCEVTVDLSYDLNKTELEIYTRESFQLKISSNGNSVDAAKAVWTSSDEKIATVSEDGTVNAVGVGTAQIKAKINYYELVCNVTVKKNPVIIPELNYTEASLDIPDTLQLEVLDYSGTCKWYSSNKDVATVDSDGVVTPVSFGQTTIRVILDDAKTLTCEIKVERNLGDINQDKDITITDVILLQSYLVNKFNFSEKVFLLADMNLDGKVNVFDFIILKRMIINKK